MEDLDMLGEEAPEGEESMPMPVEGEEMAMEESPLKDVSDDELVAEMRARGLIDEPTEENLVEEPS